VLVLDTVTLKEHILGQAAEVVLAVLVVLTAV